MLIADFVLFGFLPSYNRMRSLKQAKAEQMRAITQASAQAEELSIVEQQLQKLQAKVGKYQQSVPSERELGAFLKQIASIMTDHGLIDQVVAPAAETQNGSLNCIPINMKCKGKLAQIFEFYKRLQTSGRLVRIEKVKLVNDTDFEGLVSLETGAVIYYRPPTEQK